MSTIHSEKSTVYSSLAKGLFSSFASILILVGVLFGGMNSAHAQGMTRVSIVGMPAVLDSPYLDDQRQKFKTGQYQVQFTYTNTSTVEPVPFVFNLKISRNGNQLVDVKSEPASFQPGTHIFTSFFDRITFEKTFDEILDDLSSEVKKQVIQGGTLPEGQYVIRITAKRADEGQLASATPGIASFMVRFPEAPQLVTPENKSNVAAEQPSFSWTPVPYDKPSQISYKFLLVEVYEGQTPLKAIQGNRPYAERKVRNQMLLNYTSEFLPLEEGHRYAWRVTARHIENAIPIRNNGKSQIYTFTYQKEEEEKEAGKISEITLKAGLAKLTNVDQLSWKKDESQFRLNGKANLQIMLGKVVNIPVQVNGLTFPEGTRKNPVITGGSVVGKLPDTLSILKSAQTNLNLKRVFWRLETGLRVSAGIRLPDGRTVEAVGGIPGPEGAATLDLTNAGLIGTISAVDKEGFFKAGDDTVRMTLSSVSVRMPANARYFSGSLKLFNGDMNCDIQKMLLDQKQNDLAYLCDTPEKLSLQKNSTKLQLRIDALNGPARYHLPTDSLTYDLKANATLELQALNQKCGASSTLLLKSPGKDQFSGINTYCSGYSPIAHLGLFRLKISDVNIGQLDYNSQQGWSFNASVTGSLYMPSIGGYILPKTTATITPKGIHFSKLSYNKNELNINQPFVVGGLGIQPTQITIDSVTFPWFSWSKQQLKHKAGPWNVSMDMKLTFPGMSGMISPCFTNRSVTVNNMTLKNGSISAKISDTPVSNCKLGFSKQNKLIVDKLGGSFSGKVNADTLKVKPTLKLGAHLDLGNPLDCSKSDTLDLGDTRLTVTPQGGINGMIKNLRPTCPLTFGPLTVKINKSELSLFKRAGKQQVHYSSGISVDLMGTKNAARGSVLVDIDEGRFKNIGLQVKKPFRLDLPRKKPALSFRIGSARIDTAGLHIDGQHDLLLYPPDTTGAAPNKPTEVGVTFDKATFNLRKASLKSGRIIFNKPFAFKLGIDKQTKNLTFEATSPDTVLKESPAALIKLGTKVIIKPDGLTTSGTANALLNFGNRSYGQNFSVKYKKGFKIGLDPFGIKAGQADLLYKSQRIAYIDRTGINFTAGALTTVLPDTLPLPTRKTAFLDIKDQQGKLKLNAQKQGTSRYNLTTTSPLTLHMPALHDSSKGRTPSVNVSFSNVVYDVQQQKLVSGSISTSLGNPIDLGYLNVPLTVTRIRFAMKQLTSGQVPALFLEGNLNLFNKTLGKGAKASLYLQNANRIQGSVDIPNLNSEINLLPNSSQARLAIDSVGGSVNVPIEASGVPQFTLGADGGFWFYSSQGDTLTGAELALTIDEAGLTIDQFNPTLPSDSAAIGFNPFGFELRKLSTLQLNYNKSKQSFSFTVGLDVSFLANLSNGSTMEIPLNGAQISNSGITIQSQSINGNTSGFSKPEFSLGPTTIKLRAFHLKSDLTFNWFKGKVPQPDFSFDLGLKLAGLTSKAPELKNEWISINNAGYNNGVITGQLSSTSNFGGDGLPISFGSNAGFTVSKISGALTNDSTQQNPLQGFNIKLDGRMNMPDFYTGAAQSCQEPQVTLNFETGWKLSGTFANYTPCGKLKYGPASIGFNKNNKVQFAFGDTTRKMVLDGGITARISRPNLSDIKATGQVKVDLLDGKFISGSLTINSPFPYKLPSNNPFLTFTVQQATIDKRGFVLTGNGTINYPNTKDSADVIFNNFTIDPLQRRVTRGYVSVQDSLAFQINVGTLNWGLVDPSSNFKAKNAARVLTTANFRIDTAGIHLNGSSKGKLRAAGKNFDSLKIEYNAFNVKFDPVRVTGGKAKLFDVPKTKIGSYDKKGLHLDIEGLAKTVIPDTVALPDRKTAYLVLGDSAGKRVDLQTQGGTRTLKTKSGKRVDLVMPGFKNKKDTLSVGVTFSVTVDDLFNVTGGSVSLASKDVDLEPYLDVPVTLQKLSYKSNNKQLGASILVDLPKSLNNVNIQASALVDSAGFMQATISAGKYRTSYVPSQENVTPIASDSMSNGSLYFYVRGFKAAFGQNKQLAFSGQLKSKMMKDSAGNKTPIHYAANYENGSWNFNLDAGHVSNKGINLGFGRLKPKAVAGNKSLEVTLNKNEFTVAISGVLSFPKMAGNGFSVTMQNLEISTVKPYIDVQAQGNIPNQQFHLFGKIDTVKATNMKITVNNTVLGVKMDGSLHVYNRSVSFKGMTFKTDGTFDIKGGVNADLLGKDLVVLPDSGLVFTKLALGYKNKTLDLTIEGKAELPDPLDATSSISINADTDGNVSVSGPQFTFDKNYSIDGGPTEFGIGSFATLEVTGLGMNIKLKNPSRTSLFATGVVYVKNKKSKRIMFGDQANMKNNPGIKYSPPKKVEWNISSNFNPNTSPLRFDYEFFHISISTLKASSQATVNGKQVPFQVRIDGKTGLSISGVKGEVTYKNFKFSTEGVDNIGRITGGSFTLMGKFSLELGSFDYKNPSGNATTKLDIEKQKQNSSKKNPKTVTKKIDVKSYLKFDNSGGKALKITITNSFSGGIKKVLYYKKADGSIHLNIVQAKVSMSDHATLAASMQYVNVQNGGFLLRVAGGGNVKGKGIAAVGKIATINNKLEFGIFVAVMAPIPIVPGTVTASGVGGGFFYRPDPKDITMVKGVVQSLSQDKFTYHGKQPKPNNLDFAIFLYASVSVAGSGSVSAVNGQTLIQITDQFFKLDATVIFISQDDKLEGGLAVTVFYQPHRSGVRGLATVNVKYKPLMQGGAEINFFALKKQGQKIWGINGNYKLKVVNKLLTAKGEIIISKRGLLVETSIGQGLNLAIIQARASFSLTAWYIPNYSKAPLGAFGKFRVKFSIINEMAKFSAAVKGAYVDRSTYIMLYFAGQAHVKVVGVINGRVQGWVKFQTKSPNVSFGTGKNHQMQQLIADAKKQATKSKRQAKKTKQKIKNARKSMTGATKGPSAFKIRPSTLEKAGMNMLLNDPSISYTGKKAFNDVYWSETGIQSSIGSPIKGIAFNIIKGEIYGGSYLGIKNAGDPIPDSSSWKKLRKEADHYISLAKSESKKVQKRLTKGIKELGRISANMKTKLKTGNVRQMNSPVSGVRSRTLRNVNGNIQAGPTFRFDSLQAGSNSGKIKKFDKRLRKIDNQYRDAIASAGANLQLVNIVTSGKGKVKWDVNGKIQIKKSSNNLSIQDIGETFMAARQRIGKAHSKMIGYFWWRSKWAEHRANGISNNKNKIIEQVDWESSWFNKRDRFLYKVAGVAANRQKAILKLAGKPSRAQRESKQIANMFSRYIRKKRSNSSFKDSLRKAHKQSVKRFWYKMPLRGLRAMERKYKKQATQMEADFQSRLSKIKKNHREFTRNVDRIYTVKSEMLTTIYGMIQEYNAWRQNAIGNPVPSPLSNKKTKLKKALLPPTITKLQVGESKFTSVQKWNDKTYYGTINISFESKHPQNVPEMSLHISGGKETSIYDISGYSTAGWLWGQDTTGKGFVLWYPKKKDMQTERTFTVAVRARGSGGTTISRLASTTIPVEPEKGTRSGTTVTNNNDYSDPTKPVITHPYTFYKPNGLFGNLNIQQSQQNSGFMTTTSRNQSSNNIQMSGFNGGNNSSGQVQTGFNTYSTTYRGYYLTPDSTSLSFTINSADNETGIRRFQYKIGTSKGGGDIRGWTDAQGSRSHGANYYYVITRRGYRKRVPLNKYTNMNTTIRGLRLKHDTYYYVSFRTQNGGGLYSKTKQMKPILYDATPPQEPDLVVTPDSIKRQQAPRQPLMRSPVTSNRQFGQPSVNRDKGLLLLSRFYTYNFSSKDPESGIEGFSVATAGNPKEGISVFDPNDGDFIKKETKADTKLNYRTLSYTKPKYIYIQPRNKAGKKGPMKVFGPYYDVDVSPPTAPDARVKTISDLITIFLARKSEDAQSGVVGYQYAIGSSPGADNIRSWPDSITTDFKAPGNFKSLSMPPDVKKLNVPKLHGKKLFVSVRAVNAQGMPSRVVTTRNVIPDTTAPPKPDVTAVYGRPSKPDSSVFIEVNNIRDPETKVVTKGYRLRPKVVTPQNETQVRRGQIPAGGKLTIHAPDLLKKWPMVVEIVLENKTGQFLNMVVPIQLESWAAQKVRNKMQPGPGP